MVGYTIALASYGNKLLFLHNGIHFHKCMLLTYSFFAAIKSAHGRTLIFAAIMNTIYDVTRRCINVVKYVYSQYFQCSAQHSQLLAHMETTGPETWEQTGTAVGGLLLEGRRAMCHTLTPHFLMP